MRIEISLENKDSGEFEHEGYYDNFEDAINALYKIQKDEVVKRINSYNYPCFNCVYEYFCAETDRDPSKRCKSYKRDPPDGGYYG